MSKEVSITIQGKAFAAKMILDTICVTYKAPNGTTELAGHHVAYEITHTQKFTLDGSLLDRECMQTMTRYRLLDGGLSMGYPSTSSSKYECNDSHTGFLEAYQDAQASLLGDDGGFVA